MRRWPTLSIRATVLAAILLGVILPALLMLLFDASAARRFNAPLVERNRDALLQVALVSVTAALDANGAAADATQHALDRVMAQPNVCAVELAAAPGGAPLAVQRCPPGEMRALREASLTPAGGPTRVLRIWFSETEIEQLLGARRQVVLQLVIAQMLVGIVVIAGVLYLRLLRPIERLKEQASAIATRASAPPLQWRRGDELGQLGQHLNEVRARIDGLFEELERKNAQLRKMAMYDHLTGLPNRMLFRELFQHEAAVARRNGRSMAMLFIDLDRFKHVNDSMGHAVGDELLLGTSQRLLQSLRESERVCRHSGDEFLVLLRDAERWELVAAAAERILRAIETPLPLARRHAGDGAAGVPEVQVSASMGIALFPRDADDFDQLVRHADMAMYQSKQQGRARYSFYHAELNSSWSRASGSSASWRRRLRTTSCGCTTSRSSMRQAGASPAARRWCAGSIRCAVCCCRRASSAWPRNPAWCASSAPGPSTPPAHRSRAGRRPGSTPGASRSTCRRCSFATSASSRPSSARCSAMACARRRSSSS